MPSKRAARPVKRPAGRRAVPAEPAAEKTATKKLAKRAPAKIKSAAKNHMVHDATYGLTAEALAYARERYEKTDQPVRTIAHDVGTSTAKLYKIAKPEGWQLRRD